MKQTPSLLTKKNHATYSSIFEVSIFILKTNIILGIMRDMRADKLIAIHWMIA